MTARCVCVLLALLPLASCAGDGVVSGAGPPPPSGPTLTQLQAQIFSVHCGVAGCHAPPVPEQGMILTDGNTYAYTVNVDVVELAGFKRVLPGDSANSYLYMKISADPRIAGDRMPLAAPPLSAEEIEAVRAWIDAGALNN